MPRLSAAGISGLQAGEDVNDGFDANRDGTGTREWAEFNENISRGCAHGCLYCYAAHNATRRFHQRAPGDWQREELTKRAQMTTYPARNGLVMFPTAHDITPFNVEAYLRVAKLILGSGNRLLIVSKPHLECVTKLISELDPFKPQIMFRFTIGTMSATVARFWEPGAPPPAERLAALELAYRAGYRTSVSAEPLLGGVATAREVLSAVRPYVTDTVWIGKLNKARERVGMEEPCKADAVREIERLQTDSEIIALHAALDGDPLVRWKDSIKDVLSQAAKAVLAPSEGSM